MDNQSAQSVKFPGMQTLMQGVLIFAVGIAIVFIVKQIFWSGSDQSSTQERPAVSQPSNDFPQVTYPPRNKAEAEAGELKIEDSGNQISKSNKISVTDYQAAITAAWQELVDKGFAQRNPSQPNLVTVQYPVEPNSTQLQTQVVDISLPIIMTSTDQKQGFGYNQSVLVSINVSANHQLQLQTYQAPDFNGPGVVQALDITFDAFATFGRDYTGPLPVITAFSEYLR